MWVIGRFGVFSFYVFMDGGKLNLEILIWVMLVVSEYCILMVFCVWC